MKAGHVGMIVACANWAQYLFYNTDYSYLSAGMR